MSASNSLIIAQADFEHALLDIIASVEACLVNGILETLNYRSLTPILLDLEPTLEQVPFVVKLC